MIDIPEKNGPVRPNERIISLDVLRGFALLGILVMNVQSFANIDATYLNPTAYGDFSGINRWIWVAGHLLFDLKFISVFSILFGAGIVLMTARVESRGGSAARLHYRRTFWLLAIGAIHAYLLWHGDILVVYALCALLAYLFRRLTPGRLIVVGLVFFSVSSLIYLFFGWSLPYWPREAVRETMMSWAPDIDSIDREIAAYRGGFSDQLSHRVPMSLFMHTGLFLMLFFWRTMGCMLLGMGLFKWGVLTGERSSRFYQKLIAVGWLIGFPLVIIGLVMHFRHDFSFFYSMFHGYQFNYWGSVFVAVGYIGLMMLYCRHAVPGRIMHALSSVGRMALTNYLFQTVCCGFVFYGHGLGLFSSIDRPGQILIVVCIWILQLTLSPVWLRYFRFGPVEWLWRSLSYGHRPPMRKRRTGLVNTG
jgi:uncharacterized protein